MKVAGLDHLVLTVDNIDETAGFYERVLGMRALAFDNGRVALHFGDQKINLHDTSGSIAPRAANAVVGSADICFVIDGPIAEAVAHLQAEEVTIVHGPVAQTGARGPMTSVYFRDPSGNLVEVASYRDSIAAVLP